MSRIARLSTLTLLLAAAALAQNAAKFPPAIATDQDLLVSIDRGTTTLSAAITDPAALSFTVASATGFTGVSNFEVTIEDERILVCSVSGTTFTVCAGGRGFSGSTAATHAIGAKVNANYTAWHHNQLAAEVKAIESQLGVNLGNVVKTGSSYTDPSWLTITKSKVGLSNVENTALSTWAGSANITALGTISSGTIPAARISGAVATATALAANGSNCTVGSAAGGVDVSGAAESCVTIPKQVSFSFYDPNVALAAQTVDGVWRPEYNAATLTQVGCKADTADAVIMVRNNGANALSGNLTCGNGTWATTTSFSAASVTAGNDIGFQVVSGTMKKINFSIKYTGN